MRTLQHAEPAARASALVVQRSPNARVDLLDGLEGRCVCGGGCPTCLGGGSPGHGSRTPELVGEAIGRPGRPLPAPLRREMEESFGADFRRVRLHTDWFAERSARAIEARAFTVGDHLVFGHEVYAPEMAVGRELLAHELVHVLQQRPRTNVLPGDPSFPVRGENEPPAREAKTSVSTEVLAPRLAPAAPGDPQFVLPGGGEPGTLAAEAEARVAATAALTGGRPVVAARVPAGVVQRQHRGEESPGVQMPENALRLGIAGAPTIADALAIQVELEAAAGRAREQLIAVAIPVNVSGRVELVPVDSLEPLAAEARRRVLELRRAAQPMPTPALRSADLGRLTEAQLEQAAVQVRQWLLAHGADGWGPSESGDAEQARETLLRLEGELGARAERARAADEAQLAEAQVARGARWAGVTDHSSGSGQRARTARLPHRSCSMPSRDGTRNIEQQAALAEHALERMRVFEQRIGRDPDYHPILDRDSGERIGYEYVHRIRLERATAPPVDVVIDHSVYDLQGAQLFRDQGFAQRDAEEWFDPIDLALALAGPIQAGGRALLRAGVRAGRVVLAQLVEREAGAFVIQGGRRLVEIGAERELALLVARSGAAYTRAGVQTFARLARHRLAARLLGLAMRATGEGAPILARGAGGATTATTAVVARAVAGGESGTARAVMTAAADVGARDVSAPRLYVRRVAALGAPASPHVSSGGVVARSVRPVAGGENALVRALQTALGVASRPRPLASPTVSFGLSRPSAATPASAPAPASRETPGPTELSSTDTRGGSTPASVDPGRGSVATPTPRNRRDRGTSVGLLLGGAALNRILRKIAWLSLSRLAATGFRPSTRRQRGEQTLPSAAASATDPNLIGQILARATQPGSLGPTDELALVAGWHGSSPLHLVEQGPGGLIRLPSAISPTGAETPGQRPLSYDALIRQIQGWVQSARTGSSNAARMLLDFITGSRFAPATTWNLARSLAELAYLAIVRESQEDRDWSSFVLTLAVARLARDRAAIYDIDSAGRLTGITDAGTSGATSKAPTSHQRCRAQRHVRAGSASLCSPASHHNPDESHPRKPSASMRRRSSTCSSVCSCTSWAVQAGCVFRMLRRLSKRSFSEYSVTSSPTHRTNPHDRLLLLGPLRMRDRSIWAVARIRFFGPGGVRRIALVSVLASHPGRTGPA